MQSKKIRVPQKVREAFSHAASSTTVNYACVHVHMHSAKEGTGSFNIYQHLEAILWVYSLNLAAIKVAN